MFALLCEFSIWNLKIVTKHVFSLSIFVELDIFLFTLRRFFRHKSFLLLWQPNIQTRNLFFFLKMCQKALEMNFFRNEGKYETGKWKVNWEKSKRFSRKHRRKKRERESYMLMFSRRLNGWMKTATYTAVLHYYPWKASRKVRFNNLNFFIIKNQITAVKKISLVAFEKNHLF